MKESFVRGVRLGIPYATVGFVLSIFVLQGITDSGLFKYAQLTVNLRVFLYGMAFAVLFGMISGVYPAWRMSRLNPVQALKGGSR